MNKLYSLVIALFTMFVLSFASTASAQVTGPARTQCQALRDSLHCQEPSATNAATCQSLQRTCEIQDSNVLLCVAHNGAALQRLQAPSIAEMLAYCTSLAAPHTSTPTPPRPPIFCARYYGPDGVIVDPQAEGRCHGEVEGLVVYCDTGYRPVLVPTIRVTHGTEHMYVSHPAVACLPEDVTTASPAGHTTIIQQTQNVDPEVMCQAMFHRPCRDITNCLDAPQTADCAIARQLRELQTWRRDVVDPSLTNLCAPREGQSMPDACRQARQDFLSQPVTGLAVRGRIGLGIGALAQFPGQLAVMPSLTAGVLIPMSQNWTFDAGTNFGASLWNLALGWNMYASANVAFLYRAGSAFSFGPQIGGYAMFHFWPNGITNADNEGAGGYAGLRGRFHAHRNIAFDIFMNGGYGVQTVVNQHNVPSRLSGLQLSAGLELNFIFP